MSRAGLFAAVVIIVLGVSAAFFLDARQAQDSLILTADLKLPESPSSATSHAILFPATSAAPKERDEGLRMGRSSDAGKGRLDKPLGLREFETKAWWDLPNTVWLKEEVMTAFSLSVPPIEPYYEEGIEFVRHDRFQAFGVDLNNDTVLEIVVNRKNQAWHPTDDKWPGPKREYLLVYTKSPTDYILAGNQRLTNSSYGSILLSFFDLDGDGTREILAIAVFGRYAPRDLTVLKWDGYLYGQARFKSSQFLSFVDVDGDGKMEILDGYPVGNGGAICCATQEYFSDIYSYSAGSIEKCNQEHVRHFQLALHNTEAELDKLRELGDLWEAHGRRPSED